MDETLSLSGERKILANSIHLIRQTLNENTGLYEFSLDNIDDIYLQVKNLLSVFNGNSAHPVSCNAIANHLETLLQDYRRNDVLLEMNEVNNLIEFFNNYRLISNQTFTDLSCDTLNYKQNNVATDLATKINQLKPV